MRTRSTLIASCLGLALAGPGCVQIEEDPGLYNMSTTPSPMDMQAALNGREGNRPPFELVEWARAGRDEVLERWDQARDTYATLSQLHPEDDEPILAQARTLHAQGRAEEAARLLVEETGRGTPTPRLLQATGEALLASGDVTRALTLFHEVLAARPYDDTARVAIARSLMLLERHREVVEILDGIPPQRIPVQLLVPVARAALLSDWPAYAAELLQFHVADVPDDTEAWLDLARARLMLGDARGARDAANVALEDAGKRPDGLVLLGHAYALLADHGTAELCYDQAVAAGADPVVLVLTGRPTADAYLASARALLTRGQVSSAAVVLDAVAALDHRGDDVAELRALLWSSVEAELDQRAVDTEIRARLLNGTLAEGPP